MSSASREPRVQRSPGSASVVSAQLLALSLVLGIAIAVPLLYVQDLGKDIVPTVALITANVWAGSSLWVLSLRRSVPIAEALGVGIACAFLAPSLLLLASPFGLPTLLDWLIFPAIAAVLVAWRSAKCARQMRLDFKAPQWVGAGIAILAGVTLNRYWLELYRTPNLVDPKSFHPDMFALEAIVQANPAHGLGQMGMMADWPMRYHWLSYGWAGSLADATQATPFFTLAQILPLLAIFGTAFLVAALASRLSSRRWVPAAAALTVVCGHQIGDSSGLTINWESPSQAVSTVTLLLGLLLLLHSKQKHNLLALAMTLLVVTFVTTGFKFSAGVVLLAGIVGYIAVAVARSQLPRAYLGVIVAGVLGVGAFWLLFQSGQETGGLLFPRMVNVNDVLSPGTWFSSASNLKTAAWRTLAVLPGWAGLIYLLMRYRWKMEPIAGAALFMACGGLLPLWLLQEVAPTSTFFLASAVAGIAAISIFGGSNTLDEESRRRSRGTLLAAAIVSLCSVVLWATIAVTLANTSLVLPLLYPVVLLALIGLVLIGLRLTSIKHPARIGMAMLVIAATLSPLLVLIPERLFQSQLPMSSPRDSQTVAPSSVTESPVEIADGASISTLSGAGLGSQVMAFADDSLMPAVLIEKIRPYVSWPSWVTLNGPHGTTIEYERRLSLTEKAITGDRTARGQLCAEGVDVLASRDTGSSGFKIVPLTGDCAAQKLFP